MKLFIATITIFVWSAAVQASGSHLTGPQPQPSHPQLDDSDTVDKIPSGTPLQFINELAIKPQISTLYLQDSVVTEDPDQLKDTGFCVLNVSPSNDLRNLKSLTLEKVEDLMQTGDGSDLWIMPYKVFDNRHPYRVQILASTPDLPNLKFLCLMEKSSMLSQLTIGQLKNIVNKLLSVGWN